MKGNIGNGYIVFDWMTRRLGLSPSATHVYACLYDASGHGTRNAIFSPYEIATICGLSDWTARKSVRQLDEMGFIHIVEKRHGRWVATIDTEVLERNHIEKVNL